MRRPAFQFYPGDWKTNANLRRCSWAARGVWIEIMGLMHDSDVYGVLHWPLKEIAQAVGCPVALVREIADKGVMRGADSGLCEPFIYTPRSGRQDGDPVELVPVQPGPVWYSSRMVKDEHVRGRLGAGSRFGSEGRQEQPQRASGDDRTERAKLRAKVLEKTDGACFHCKKPLGQVWEIDHYIPRSKGGRHTFSNMVPSCAPCNQDKSDSMPDDWAKVNEESASDLSPTRRKGDGKRDGPSTSSSSSNSTSIPTKLPSLTPRAGAADDPFEAVCRAAGLVPTERNAGRERAILEGWLQGWTGVDVERDIAGPIGAELLRRKGVTSSLGRFSKLMLDARARAVAEASGPIFDHGHEAPAARDLRRAIGKALSAAEVRSAVAPCAIDVSDGVAVITAPSAFAAEHLGNQFGVTIRAVAKGMGFEVRIVAKGGA